MTEPTDDELDAVIAEYQTRIYPQDMRPRFERAIMRAAIAKWGTQPSGVVNWVGLSSHHLLKQEPLGAEFEAVLDKHRSELYAEATPQPTQAQAGAVPLTDEQLYEERQTAISQLFDLAQQWADNKIHSYQFGHEAEKIVDAVARRVEAAHGIKGGQHGESV